MQKIKLSFRYGTPKPDYLSKFEKALSAKRWLSNYLFFHFLLHANTFRPISLLLGPKSGSSGLFIRSL
jgi:hypothetical protein